MLTRLIRGRSIARRGKGRSHRAVAPGLFGGLVLFLWGVGLPGLSDAQTVTYTYDTCANGNGRLCAVSDSSGTVAFSYDTMARVVQTDKVVDGNTYTTKTGYDDIGRVKSIGYPDNLSTSVVYYLYSGSALSQVYDATTTYATYSNYNALGQPGTVAFGNNVTTTYTYFNASNSVSTCKKDNFRLCTIKTTLGGTTSGTIYQNLQYNYDSAGNVSAITDTINGNQTFVYDELNRLTSATGPYGGGGGGGGGSTSTLTYAYDPIGNMTCNSSLSTCSSSSLNYTYGDPSHAHAVTNAGGNNYTYDTTGNMLTGAGKTMTYDPYNRLVSVVQGTTTTSFVYDGDGGRVKKTVNGVTTVYIGQLYECAGGSCSKYIFAGGQRIANKVVGANTANYYHGDHLGSSSVVTTETGASLQQLTYFPYGATRTNSLGSGSGVPYKFTGQALDDSTGLYFYGARYYDPALGRFISADPTTNKPFDPQALNRYSYARNNPLRYTDPTGNDFCDFCSYIGGLIYDYIIAPVIDAALWAAQAVEGLFTGGSTIPAQNISQGSINAVINGSGATATQVAISNADKNTYGGETPDQLITRTIAMIAISPWGNAESYMVDSMWAKYKEGFFTTAGFVSGHDDGANYDIYSHMISLNLDRISQMPNGLEGNLAGIIIHEVCHAACIGQIPFPTTIGEYAQNDAQALSMQASFNRSYWPSSKLGYEHLDGGLIRGPYPFYGCNGTSRCGIDDVLIIYGQKPASKSSL